MSRHENLNKKRIKWRYVYHKFRITRRFNIEDTKGINQIRVMDVKKSYIWRDVIKAVTFYFFESRAQSMSLQICSAFLPFIVDLTFGKT